MCPASEGILSSAAEGLARRRLSLSGATEPATAGPSAVSCTEKGRNGLAPLSKKGAMELSQRDRGRFLVPMRARSGPARLSETGQRFLALRRTAPALSGSQKRRNGACRAGAGTGFSCRRGPLQPCAALSETAQRSLSRPVRHRFLVPTRAAPPLRRCSSPASGQIWPRTVSPLGGHRR